MDPRRSRSLTKGGSALVPALSTIGLALAAHIPCCGLPAALGLLGGTAALASVQFMKPWFLLLAAVLIAPALLKAFKPISCANRNPVVERGVAIVGLAVLLFSGVTYARDLKSPHSHAAAPEVSSIEIEPAAHSTEDCDVCDDH